MVHGVSRIRGSGLATDLAEFKSDGRAAAGRCLAPRAIRGLGTGDVAAPRFELGASPKPEPDSDPEKREVKHRFASQVTCVGDFSDWCVRTARVRPSRRDVCPGLGRSYQRPISL